MENQPLLGPGKYDSSGSHLAARPQCIEAARPQMTEGRPNLLEYWDILRRRKGTLIVTAFLGLLAAVLLTLPQMPVYQARVLVEIQNINENFLNMREVNPTVSDSGRYPPEYDLQTQVKIFQSESVLDRVAGKLQLEKRFSVGKDGRLAFAWRRALALIRRAPVSPRHETLEELTKNLEVRAQMNTRVVEILYSSTDPKLAAEIANALTAEYIEQNLEGRWQITQRTGEWLARQMEDFRIKLEKSEERLQSYALDSGLVFTAEKDNVVEEKLRQLQLELSKAQADRIARQSKHELALSASPDSLPDVLDDATLRDYQVKLTDLRRQLAELTSSMTGAHPAVKKVLAQVTTLEAALDRERANITARIRNEFDSARRRENLVSADYAAQARLMSAQAAKVTHYNLLKREVDRNRQLYDSMLQRVNEAGIASALRASNIRVIDSAKPPERPYKPSLPLNVALGLLTGVFLGAAFVVMRERADLSIQGPGETPAYLNIPELGVIPSARAVRRSGNSYYGYRESTEKEVINVELATWQKTPSLLAESFRATLASILYSGENGNRPRVIVLTSANVMEGKTSVASNLALALAEMGQRVLLIDGDLRKPRLHEVFRLPNEWGFSDLLEGKNPPEGREALVMGTGYGDLYLLPAGSASQNIPRLLRSERAAAFLTRVKHEFDTVLIDTPPMGLIPDARDLGRLVDGVILVVRSTETTRDMAAAASHRLIEDGTRVLGTVLNQWDPKRTSHYGYSYHYYQRG
ncbi:MAG TPA: polysaccharide biosynthesis tyrosine autokinase [Bryobacteraceae bacterium]|nr:polysaccharide biosynthesis tyrosine autokinase [Bryobacteraceae bacterium]